MSAERRSRLADALRAAFEAFLPDLVDDALARLDDPPAAPVRLKANVDALPPLLAAAQEGGADAVLTLLPEGPEELRAIALALDRVLAARFRKARNIDRLRQDIAAEIDRRAHRNDVFVNRD